MIRTEAIKDWHVTAVPTSEETNRWLAALFASLTIVLSLMGFFSVREADSTQGTIIGKGVAKREMEESTMPGLVCDGCESTLFSLIHQARKMVYNQQGIDASDGSLLYTEEKTLPARLLAPQGQVGRSNAPFRRGSARTSRRAHETGSIGCLPTTSRQTSPLGGGSGAAEIWRHVGNLSARWSCVGTFCKLKIREKRATSSKRVGSFVRASHS